MIVKDFKINDSDKKLLANLIYRNPYCNIKPTPLQLKILILANRLNKTGLNDILVGGSAGVGKTYLLTLLCLQNLLIPNSNTLVLRNAYNELVSSGSVFDLLSNELIGNGDIDIIQSKPPLIRNNKNGARIFFMSTSNNDRAKSSLQGTSYCTILCDESSYMEVEVLQFLYRSLREKHGNIPMKLVHASNPSPYKASEWLRKHYIEGDGLFILTKYGQNPYLTEGYYANLNKLPYSEKQYLLYGNWNYTQTKGDLIDSDTFDNCMCNLEDYNIKYKALSVDLASTGP